MPGYAAQDIVDQASEHDCDLILMGTHGRTGLKRFLIGSVAEKVVRRTPCPVFIVKSFGSPIVDNEAAFEDEE
jgi:nucleotide-binding universal stress UspA family protein